MEKNYEFQIGYHSNFNFECNTERGFNQALSIALFFFSKDRQKNWPSRESRDQALGPVRHYVVCTLSIDPYLYVEKLNGLQVFFEMNT